MQLITINDAATLARRSIQTIRRMIKQKKIHVKRQKTPQGFNYLIVKESLTGFLEKDSQMNIQQQPTSQNEGREHRSIASSYEDLFKTELDRFNSTIQKLIEQNEKDKDHFFQLIKTFQERNGILESRIKLLESPARRWWQIWK